MCRYEFPDEVLQIVAFNEFDALAYFVVAETGQILGADADYLAFPGGQVQVSSPTRFVGMVGQVIEVLPTVFGRENDVIHT